MSKSWLDVITDAAKTEKDFVAASNKLTQATALMDEAKRQLQDARRACEAARHAVFEAALAQVRQISGVTVDATQHGVNMPTGLDSAVLNDWQEAIRNVQEKLNRLPTSDQTSYGSQLLLSPACSISPKNHLLTAVSHDQLLADQKPRLADHLK